MSEAEAQLLSHLTAMIGNGDNVAARALDMVTKYSSKHAAANPTTAVSSSTWSVRWRMRRSARITLGPWRFF